MLELYQIVVLFFIARLPPSKNRARKKITEARRVGAPRNIASRAERGEL